MPDIEPDLAEARAALNQDGIVDLERAQSALRHARLRYREEITAQRERQGVNMCRMLEAEADLALARSRFLEAAHLFAEAASESPPHLAEKIGELRHKQGASLFRYGEIFPGLETLERAVEAYEAALEVYTRAEMPADWAMTQNNLANALGVMGERAGGAAGLKALERAVEAYEAALEVTTRTEMPADWAATQNNLAGALLVIGERAGGAAGRKALERAVEACEAALEVYTRAEMPGYWSHPKTGLGCAQVSLGIATTDAPLVKDGIETIDEAVGTFRSSASQADVERVLAFQARGVGWLQSSGS